MLVLFIAFYFLREDRKSESLPSLSVWLLPVRPRLEALVDTGEGRQPHGGAGLGLRQQVPGANGEIRRRNCVTPSKE